MSYNNAKPNFCQKCGTPVGGVKPATSRAASNSDNDEDEDLDEDETSSNSVPNLKKLQLEDDGESPVARNVTTLGNLFGRPTAPIRTAGRRNIDDFIDERKSR